MGKREMVVRYNKIIVVGRYKQFNKVYVKIQSLIPTGDI